MEVNYASKISRSHSWLNEYMNVDELIEHGALIWEAHWNNDGKICEDKFAISQESSDYYLNDGTRVDFDIMRDDVFDRLIKANEYDHRDDIDGNDNSISDNNAETDVVDTEQLQYQIGDCVEYNTIYASSTSESGLTPSQGFNSGTITRVIPWAANPYLINDGTGWINDGCITSEDNSNTESSDNDINVGDKVRVLVNATYDGGSFAMYYDEYDVLEVKGDRVVIGIGDVVTCAINICNIERI